MDRMALWRAKREKDKSRGREELHEERLRILEKIPVSPKWDEHVRRETGEFWGTDPEKQPWWWQERAREISELMREETHRGFNPKLGRRK